MQQTPEERTGGDGEEDLKGEQVAEGVGIRAVAAHEEQHERNEDARRAGDAEQVAPGNELAALELFALSGECGYRDVVAHG